MTTPPQGPRGSGDRGEPASPDAPTTRFPTSDPPTRRFPTSDPATARIPHTDQPTREIARPGRPDAPTDQIRPRSRPADAPAPSQSAPPPPPPVTFPSSGGGAPQEPTKPAEPKSKKPRGKRFGDTKSIILIVIIVVALIAGGLAGAELFARYKANSVLVAVTECIVKDSASVSIATTPPFLWQYFNSDYTDITVTTAGNQIQEAKGMKAEVSIADVKLADTANSKGTIGSLDATLTWTAAGIKDTVAENLPGVGRLVSDVTTDAAAGTINLDAGVITVQAKPVVTDGKLQLEIVGIDGGLGKDVVQTALNNLTDKLNDNYPLGIKADSIQVTDTGVVGKFSTRNASIPAGQDDECFSKL